MLLAKIDKRIWLTFDVLYIEYFGFTFDGMYDPVSISVLHGDYQESSKIQKGCAE